MLKLPLRAVLVACALTLGGCAAGARSELMVAAAPTAFAAEHQLRNSVAMQGVQGGEDTNPLLSSNIANDQFQAALEQSMRNAGLLASSDEAARYRLSASMQELNQPMVGLDMSVTITVRYTITPVAGGAPIFDAPVRATGVGRLSQAFAGTERLRIANEAAARENIAEFLRQLQARVPAASIAPVS